MKYSEQTRHVFVFQTVVSKKRGHKFLFSLHVNYAKIKGRIFSASRTLLATLKMRNKNSRNYIKTIYLPGRSVFDNIVAVSMGNNSNDVNMYV